MENNKKEKLKIKPPKKCHLWKKKKLNSSDLIFEEIKTYINDTSLVRKLVKCKKCNQFYYDEMYQTTNWQTGNDKVYRTYIPIENDAQIIKTLNNYSPESLTLLKPAIFYNPDGQVFWST